MGITQVKVVKLMYMNLNGYKITVEDQKESYNLFLEILRWKEEAISVGGK